MKHLLSLAVASLLLNGCDCPCKRACSAPDSASLENAFFNPPREAKPHTWYHMMNGNVTKEGITCDFEALAKAGIGGVQMFDAGCAIPPGGLNYNSPEWFEMFSHAEKEANRLGLEICIPNCSGWSSSGGPWNPPSNAMKRVVHTITSVKGPSKFNAILPRTKSDNGYYADIAVMAVPDRKPAVVKTVRHELNGATMFEEYEKVEQLCGATIDFAVTGWFWGKSVSVDVEVSDNGQRFFLAARQQIDLARSGSVDAGLKYLDFGKVCKAKALRVKITRGYEHGSGKIKVVNFGGALTPMLAGLNAKTFDVRARIVSKLAPADSTTVRKDEVIDLTSSLAADGSLAWNVPAGDWKLVRIGVICNGRKNHPASDHGVGLEVDKLSSEALNYHFDQYVTRLCDTLGKRRDGKGIGEGLGFNNILVDSYEVGSQNWTQKMEAEFLKRRGYSLRPYLPVFAKVVVGSFEETERFLEDFRRTVADLFAENYSGALQKKCNERGLMLSVEPYGNCPADNLQYGQYCDIPMGEFWSNAAGGNFNTGCGNSKYVSYLAHFWGRKFCATESFTADPGGGGRWQTTPFTIKTQGDHAYALGVNRIIYHRFTHQPWPGKQYVPGMTMGRWGMHLDRTQTWWDYSQPWFKYQARCQSMLQRGTYVADILFFCGEQAPNQGGNTDGGSAAMFKCPEGLSHDNCATAGIYALTVGEDGRLVSPGGVRYAFLAVPEFETMTPGMLKALIALADKGAKLSGRHQPVRAPGLSFGKAGDEEVRKLAAQLWAHKNFVKGTPDEAAKTLGLKADVRAESVIPEPWRLAWIHRAEKGADWYFVCTANREETEIELSFNQSGKVPELWDAESCTIADAGIWREENGRTFVTIPMSVSGSKFVVFRRPSAGVRHVVSAAGNFPAEKLVLSTGAKPVFTRVVYGVIENGKPVSGLFVDATVKCNAAVKDGYFSETLSNAFFGRDPAMMRPKKILIEYTFDGRTYSRVLNENSLVSIPEKPLAPLAMTVTGSGVRCARSGSVELKWSDGKVEKKDVKVTPAAIVEGAWEVEFPHAFAPNGTVHAEGAPEKVTFPKLSDWSIHKLEGVRYFSGTAIYRKEIDISAAPGERIELDLGQVMKVAEVTVNGKTYPALWKPPFRVDITDALKGGSKAKIEIKVANLWANRLIGDDRTKSPDCEWTGVKTITGVKEIGIKKIPEWVKRGEKSPTGRFTFTTWQHWDKNDKLLPSGLLGPVILRPLHP